MLESSSFRIFDAAIRRLLSSLASGESSLVADEEGPAATGRARRRQMAQLPSGNESITRSLNLLSPESALSLGSCRFSPASNSPATILAALYADCNGSIGPCCVIVVMEAWYREQRMAQAEEESSPSQNLQEAGAKVSIPSFFSSHPLRSSSSSRYQRLAMLRTAFTSIARTNPASAVASSSKVLLPALAPSSCRFSTSTSSSAESISDNPNPTGEPFRPAPTPLPGSQESTGQSRYTSLGPKLHRLHVQATRNNTILTFTDPDGNPLHSCSGGTVGFKKAARSGYEAGYRAAFAMFTTIAEKKNEWTRAGKTVGYIHLFWNGFGEGREAVYRALLAAEGYEVRGMVKKMSDSTKLKIGGVRPKKRRSEFGPYCCKETSVSVVDIERIVH